LVFRKMWTEGVWGLAHPEGVVGSYFPKPSRGLHPRAKQHVGNT